MLSFATKALLIPLIIVGFAVDGFAVDGVIKDEMWLCWIQARPTDLCLSYLTARIENPSEFTPAEQSQNLSKRATVFQKRSDYGLAVQDASKALELDAANVTALSTRALIRLRSGSYDEAIADYSSIIEAVKNNAAEKHPLPLAIKSKADALVRAKRWERAIEEYTNAIHEIENSKLSVLTHNGITVMSETIGPLEIDPKAFQSGQLPPKVVPANKSPLAAQLFTLRGDAYSVLGDADRARDDYKRAEEITPTLRPLRSITVDPDKSRQ
jgi:tetratricopeptide (TPR) repeat protein